MWSERGHRRSGRLRKQTTVKRTNLVQEFCGLRLDTEEIMFGTDQNIPIGETLEHHVVDAAEVAQKLTLEVSLGRSHKHVKLSELSKHQPSSPPSSEGE